jgi:hypothetical protein
MSGKALAAGVAADLDDRCRVTFRLLFPRTVLNPSSRDIFRLPKNPPEIPDATCGT